MTHEHVVDIGRSFIWALCRVAQMINFNFQFFISFHRAIQIVLFSKLSASLTNCTYILFVFIFTIHDIVYYIMIVLW